MARKNKSNQQSREYLLKAFVKLMETENYSDITVTDITKAAGVSRMAYYRNYTAKDQILTMYLDDIGQSIIHPRNEYVLVPKTEDQYIVLLFKRLAADARVYEYNLGRALNHAGLGNLFLDSIVKNLSAAFPEENESFKNQAMMHYAMIAGSFYGLYMLWSQNDHQDNVAELAELLQENVRSMPKYYEKEAYKEKEVNL